MIQLASEVTLQEHSRSVVTAMLPVPPLASMEGVDVVSETWHFSGEGPVPVETFDDVQALVASTKAIAGAGHHRARRSRRRVISCNPIQAIRQKNATQSYIEYLRSGCDGIRKAEQSATIEIQRFYRPFGLWFSKMNVQWRGCR